MFLLVRGTLDRSFRLSRKIAIHPLIVASETDSSGQHTLMRLEAWGRGRQHTICPQPTCPKSTAGAGTERDVHRVHAENAVAITKAPSISQLPLQHLWHERETNLESCIPDEQNDAPHQPEKTGLRQHRCNGKPAETRDENR